MTHLLQCSYCQTLGCEDGRLGRGLGIWRGPSTGEYRSDGTCGSNPRINVPDLPPEAKPTSQGPGD